MARIAYFFTTLSPWAYLAGDRLERIAERHGAEIDYHPLDVGALLARTGGQSLPDRHQSRRDYRLQDLRRTAARLGMPITLQPAHWPVNAAPSSYAVLTAIRAVEAGTATGSVGALVQGFLRACWAEERNIAEDGVIREVLEASGFEPALADRGMLASAETYGRNLEEAVSRGVFGAPFYIVGDERFWGQDRLDDLDAHLAGQP